MCKHGISIYAKFSAIQNYNKPKKNTIEGLFAPWQIPCFFVVYEWSENFILVEFSSS